MDIQFAPFLLSMGAGVVAVLLLKYGLRFLSWISISFLYAFPSRYRASGNPENDHIQILVLGDIGRSPRMQYHAISFAKHRRKVDIVAYKGIALPFPSRTSTY